VDYNAQYDPFPKKAQIPAHVIDHNRLVLDPDDSLSAWQSRPDLKHIVSMTFRYQAHRTSNANARDQLRYGTCETLFARMPMWGFETYQEFRDHLAVRDKTTARDTWEEIGYELRNNSCKFLFWIPKTPEHQTEPGCWAITIEQSESRSAVVWSDNQIRAWSGLRLTKQNQVVVGRQD
jgi:hypothetical protein